MKGPVPCQTPVPSGCARPAKIAFGDGDVDACLPHGLVQGWHEIAADGIEAETGALAAGFAASWLARLAGPVLWIAPSADLFAPGLRAYGLDPARVIMAHTHDDDDTLAAAETALRGSAAVAVVAEVGRMGRLAGRRLHLACLAGRTIGLVLRRWPHGRRDAQGGAAASTRWRLAPAPSAIEDGESGPPRWIVRLEHASGGQPGAWLMQAGELGEAEDSEDAAFALRVVAPVGGDAPQAGRRRA